MSEQPPVQPPDQPAAGTPPTRPMPAAGQPAPPAGPPAPVAGPPATTVLPAGPPVPPAGPPAAYLSGEAPKPNMWHRATSTRGGRWGLVIAAGALVCLMILGFGVAGVVILRNHDRVTLLGQSQDGYSRGQNGPGNGRGLNNGRGFGNRQGPGANGYGNGAPNQPGMPGAPGMPGGRAQGLGGLANLLGGTVMHGDVTGTLNGSVQALVFQRGEVTAVSGTSITLKSSDGFVGTYGRNAATRSRGAAPVKGGQALVLARSSDKVAITIMVTPNMAGVAPSN